MSLDIYYEALISVDFVTLTDQTDQLPFSVPLGAFSTDIHMNTGKKIYFGASDKHSIYSDDTDLFISSSSGDVQISGAIYAASHIHWGDADVAYWGANDDWGLYYDEATTDSLILRDIDGPSLAFKKSAPTFTAAADTDGNDIFIGSQSGGAHTSNDPDGGSITFQPGAAGSGGSGAAGTFQIKDPGSADVLKLSHNGSQALISTSAHYVRFDSSAYINDAVFLGLGSGADWRLKNNTANPANHLELMEAATPTLAFYGSTLVAQGFDAGADTAGNDIFIATQTAGTDGGANPRGGNLAFELGTGTGTGVQGILSVNGPVALTPATAAVGLTINMGANDAAGLSIDGQAGSAANRSVSVTGKYVSYWEQDISSGYVAHFYRNVAEAGSTANVRITDEHASTTQHSLSIRTDSSTATTAAAQLLRNGITTTSTDGLLLENSTAALVGETVEMAPRIRLRGHAWKSNATAASQSHDWIIENVPATGAAATTSTLTIKNSNNGGGYANKFRIQDDGEILVQDYINYPDAVGPRSNANNITLVVQDRSQNAANSAVEMATGTWTHSTGAGIALHLKPVWNSSGDSSETCLLIDSTSTTVGSGAYMLIEAKDDTATKLSVDSAGNVVAAATGYFNSLQTAASFATQANDATMILQWRDFTGTDTAVEMVTGTFSGGNGTQFVGVHIKPIYNDAGATSAAATALAVSVTETDLGSGAQLLADLGTTTDGTYGNHTSKWKVSNVGVEHTTAQVYTPGSDLTIDGSDTVTATNSFHRIIVNGGTGSGADDLDIITAGTDGQIIIIAPKTSGVNDTVTAKDGGGNLALAGDFAMDHVNDRLVLMYNTADTAWVEICRSSNA